MNLAKFRKSLEDAEASHRITLMEGAWASIEHKQVALADCYPSWESKGYNDALFFTEMILNEKDFTKVTERLDRLLKADAKIVAKIEADKFQVEYRMFTSKRNKYLADTDWTQLADVELDKKSRDNYRKYRKYLRNLPDLYQKKVVDKLEVLDLTAYLGSYLYSINLPLGTL